MTLIPSYTTCLQKLAEIEDEDKIFEAPKIYGIGLAKAVNEYYDHEQKVRRSRPIEHYQFMKFIAKAGQSIVAMLWEAANKREVVAKFALPTLTAKPHDNPVQFRIKQKKAIWAHVSLFKKKKVGLSKDIAQQRETEHTERFKRGCEAQKKLHHTLIKKGLSRYGYIPEIYLIGRSPKQFVVMEYIEGKDLLRWCKENIRTGETYQKAIFEMFFNIIMVIEGAVHFNSIVYSDIKHNNIVVVNDLPVLIDFNICKDLNKPSVTSVETKGGSQLYSSRDQLQNFKNRDYRDDIFGLGLLLWAMWSGKDPEQKFFDDAGYIDVQKTFTAKIFPLVLQKVFAKATNIKRHRYQDISEFREELETIKMEYEACNNVATIELLQELKNRIEKVEKVDVAWVYNEEKFTSFLGDYFSEMCKNCELKCESKRCHMDVKKVVNLVVAMKERNLI